MIAYFSCVQVWKFAHGVFSFAGSTHDVEGKVVDATIINADRVLIQVLRRNSTVLEIHELNEKPSYVNTLVLPPSGSGPSPYKILCPPGCDYLCVVAANGLISLFDLEDYHCLSLSGLETELSSTDGSPLLDICGRWLVYAPKRPASNKTPLKLPPSGPLYERIMENVSSTAAAGLKSLSDAGVAGLKHYFKLDENEGGGGVDIGSNGHHLMHYNNGGTSSNGGTGSGSSMINRGILNGLLFNDSSSTTIQIIDIPTESTICSFTPLYGLTHLSISPYDAALATVSSKGDHVYTYDLSFLPSEVSVVGRYVRGKLPAKVSRVLWDNHGGLGIITSEKGSLHWFDKRRSLDSSNKVWKLSGWGIEDGAVVGRKDDEEPLEPTLETNGTNNDTLTPPVIPVKILLLKQNQVMISDPATGNCIWKYDLPLSTIDEANDDEEVHEDTDDDEERNGDTKKPAKSEADPLSFYEMETCLPYPYIHTDRRVILSVFTIDDQGYEQFDCSVVDTDDGSIEYPKLESIGARINRTTLDFGRACGQAKFSPDIVGSNGPEEEDEEIRKAMESMVLLKDDDHSVGTATSKETMTNQQVATPRPRKDSTDEDPVEPNNLSESLFLENTKHIRD